MFDLYVYATIMAFVMFLTHALFNKRGIFNNLFDKPLLLVFVLIVSFGCLYYIQKYPHLESDYKYILQSIFAFISLIIFVLAEVGLLYNLFMFINL